MLKDVRLEILLLVGHWGYVTAPDSSLTNGKGANQLNSDLPKPQHRNGGKRSGFCIHSAALLHTDPFIFSPLHHNPSGKDVKVLCSPVAKTCLKFMPAACFTLFFLYPVMLLVWGWCWVAACGLLLAHQLGILGELFALLWDRAPAVGRQFTVLWTPY